MASPSSSSTVSATPIAAKATPSTSDIRSQLAQKVIANKQIVLQRSKPSEPTVKTGDEEPVPLEAAKTMVLDGNSFVVTPDYIQQSKLEAYAHIHTFILINNKYVCSN